MCPQVPDVETKAQGRVQSKNLGLQPQAYVTLDFHNQFLVSGKRPCSNPQYTDLQLRVKMSLHTQLLCNSDSFHVKF